MLMIDTRIDIFTRVKLEDAVMLDDPQKRIDGIMEVINEIKIDKDEEIDELNDTIEELENEKENLIDRIAEIENE